MADLNQILAQFDSRIKRLEANFNQLVNQVGADMKNVSGAVNGLGQALGAMRNTMGAMNDFVPAGYAPTQVNTNSIGPRDIGVPQNTLRVPVTYTNGSNDAGRVVDAAPIARRAEPNTRSGGPAAQKFQGYPEAFYQGAENDGD